MRGPVHREQGCFPANPRPFGWVGSGTPPTSSLEDGTPHQSSRPWSSKGSLQQSPWYIFGFALPLQGYFQLPLPEVSSIWSNRALLWSGSHHIFHLAQPQTCPGCVAGHWPSTLAIAPLAGELITPRVQHTAWTHFDGLVRDLGTLALGPRLLCVAA